MYLIETIIYVAWFSSQTSLPNLQNLHQFKPQQHWTNDRMTRLFYTLQLEYNFLQQSKFSWVNYYQRCPSQVCPSQVSVNSNVNRTAAFSSWHLQVAYFLDSFSINGLHEWERFYHVVSLFNISVYSDLESSFTGVVLYIKRLNPALSDGIKAVKDLNHFRWDLLFSLLYFRLFWLFLLP